MAQGTVLVVDDDEAIREVVRMVLADEGYRVPEAREGTEALALAAATPCVILLDMAMPGSTDTALATARRWSA